ncbi:unnamed protein product [Chrysodeixis includens]|uniref:Uncharacterized protein n=1 Tax=Chrysodeixis includens TaxID=689277 RepID=A0A9N8KT94_CHRIL|nr:unnamed protein product [Chrysodeixis includens]
MSLNGRALKSQTSLQQTISVFHLFHLDRYDDRTAKVMNTNAEHHLYRFKHTVICILTIKAQINSEDTYEIDGHAPYHHHFFGSFVRLGLITFSVLSYLRYVIDLSRALYLRGRTSIIRG